MIQVYKKTHKGKIRRATCEELGSNFVVYYFSVSKRAYINEHYKSEEEAKILLKREGYKRQMTKGEYIDFQRSESLKRIRIWLLDRKQLLNFEGISKQSGIGEQNFKAWLSDTKKELTALQYNKLRTCIKVIRGS